MLAGFVLGTSHANLNAHQSTVFNRECSRICAKQGAIHGPGTPNSVIKYLAGTKLVLLAYLAGTPDEFRYFGGINFSDVWGCFYDFHIVGTFL